MGKKEKAMSGSKSTIVVVLSVLGLIIGYFAITRFGLVEKKVKDSPKIEKISVLKIEDKLNSMQINIKGEVFKLEKNGKLWNINTPKGLETDSERVQKIETNISDLIAYKSETDNKDLASMGLDSPLAIIVNSVNGKSYSIDVGGLTSDKKGYYLKKKDDEKIYIVDTKIGEALKVSKEDLRNKSVLPNSSDNIDEVTLKQKQKVSYTLKKNGKEWNMTFPQELNANTKDINSMLVSIGKNKASGFKETSDPAEYGLDEPKYVLTFKAKGAEKVLIVGSENGDEGSFYCMFEGKKEVFSVGVTGFEFFEKPLNEVANKNVYQKNLNDITNIRTTVGGTSTGLGIAKDVFTVDGIGVKKGSKAEELAKAYFQKVSGVSIVEIDTLKPILDADDIVATIELNSANSGFESYVYTKNDDKTYYVFRNGIYMGALADKKTIDDFTKLGKDLKVALN